MKKSNALKREPMLASPAPPSDKIAFPIYGSVKLDGIRCTADNAEPISRSGKILPNRFLQKYFRENPQMNGLDGELIVGDPNASDVYRKTMSAIMSEDGEPDFLYYVFDDTTKPDEPYYIRQRIMMLKTASRVVVLEQANLNNIEELDKYESDCLEMGYEGLVLRKIDGHYKFGRSSTKEGLLLKLKRFTDAEAVVVGFQEEEENLNEAQKNEFGRTKRSSHKGNKKGKGTLGALWAIETDTGRRFKIGSGFKDDVAQEIWDNQSKYLGKWAKYSYFKIGVKDLPRHSRFLGWRDPRDMSPKNSNN
jgi:DNA ligase-1